MVSGRNKPTINIYIELHTETSFFFVNYINTINTEITAGNNYKYTTIAQELTKLNKTTIKLIL